MKYRCHDIFMVRVPALPSFHVQDFIETKKSTKDYINEKNLQDFFGEALLISSQSLHKAFCDSTQEEKKIEMTNKGLSKYLVRAASRPTPFGTWSRVGLGKWGQQDNIIISADIKRKRIQVDDQWISAIIMQLEQDIQVREKLNLKINPIIYSQGDRIQNPFFSNHGLVGGESKVDVITRNHIKKTGLIELLWNEAENFIAYEKIVDKIIESYEGIPKELVHRTLNQLLVNEILLSNLRLPSFCINSLKYVLAVLKGIEYKTDLFEKLCEIDKLMSAYESDLSGQSILKKLYKKMAQIHQSQNYIKVDTGIVFKENTLSCEIKKKLENFTEKLSFICPNGLENVSLNRFKKEFSEKYGTNVDVPIKEIIDENLFNGLDKFPDSQGGNLSKREEEIKSVFDKAILEAYINKNDEINLTLEDFSNINLKDKTLNFATSFDLNIFISKNNEHYKLAVGPNVGAFGAGKMFQRFSQVYNQRDYQEYNTIYQKIIQNSKKNYCIAEVREAHVAGRTANVISTNKTYDYHLALGNTEETFYKELLLHDLAIGISGDKLYIKSIRTGEIVKITTNHMLNPNLNSKIQRLLIAISDEYECFPLKRVYSLYQNSYSYVPRIVFEDVVLRPKMWNIVFNQFDCTTFKSFCKDLIDYINLYNVDRLLYLVESDNRLIIDITQKEYQQQLYDLLKNKKLVNLRELEDKTFRDFFVKNEYEERYITEFVFSFVRDEERIHPLQNRRSHLVQNLDHQYALGDEGWIYFKLYGVNSRENEFLTRYLQPALKNLPLENFFFLRYSDKQRHLRIRLKFEATTQAIDGLKELHSLLTAWKDKGLYSHVVFDTYEPEINRYGGLGVLDPLHSFFQTDSLWVMAMLENFQIENGKEKEMTYFVGMLSAMLALSNSVEDLFEILDEEGLRESNKSQFKKERLKYLAWFEKIIYNDIEKIDDRFVKVLYLHYERTRVCQDFNKKIVTERENLTNEKKEVIFSLVHMFCNRMTGSVKYESYLLSIIRHTVYNYLQKQKSLSKVKKEKEKEEEEEEI